MTEREERKKVKESVYNTREMNGCYGGEEENYSKWDIRGRKNPSARSHSTSNSPAQLTSNWLGANILILSPAETTRAEKGCKVYPDKETAWHYSLSARRARRSVNLDRLNKEKSVSEVAGGETDTTWHLLISLPLTRSRTLRLILESHECRMGMLEQN